MTDRAIMEQALQILSGRRMQKERELNIRKTHLYNKLPRLQEIDRQLSLTGLSVAKAVLSADSDVNALIKKLQDENLTLQEERKELLKSAGLSLSDMEVHYNCHLCSDTGYVNGKMCDCLRQLIRTVSYRRLCEDFPMEEMTFSSFSLDRFSNEEEKMCMEQILMYCKQYADTFTPKRSPSLYFFGGTGLGKTHLSLAIAGAVTTAGYQVVYGSWQGFLSKMEEQKFTAGQSMEETLQALTSCDLLILDDVGAEFITSFGITCLHQVLNTRINRGLPTIISSNISPEFLVDNYNERIASRICGTFEMLPFQGHDQRIR